MNKRRYIWILILILLVFLQVLTACQDTAPAVPGEEPSVNGDIDYDPSDSPPLRVSITRPNQLNPLLNGNETLFQLYHLIYESLITFDENMALEPLLASGWELDVQGQSVTFSLRDNVTWHDGEPFTPEDVVFTFQVMREQMNRIAYPNLYINNLQQISDVRKIDDHSVRFTFTRPYSNALETLVFPIIPQHLFSGADRSLLTTGQFPIVGTGRYKVEAYDSQSMELSYYPDYWGRKPYIEEILVNIVPDREAQISLFESGQIDLVEPLSVDWAKYTDGTDVEGISFPSTQYEFIGFNFNNELLQNLNVRKAVMHALDRESMIQNVYFNHGIAVESPVFPASWLRQREALHYEYDETMAEELLSQEALPEGTTFSLITNTGNPMRGKMVEVITEALERVGFNIEMEIFEWEELQTRLEEGNFDLVLTGWQFSMIPDLSFAFHSTQIGAGNMINYENEEMDRLLETAFAAPNEREKMEAWNRLQDHITSELPYISLLFKEHAVMHRITLKGELQPTQFNTFRGIETSYLIRPRDDAAAAGQ